MKNLQQLETAVLKTLGRASTEGEGNVSIGVIEQAAIAYHQQYGYIPEVWSKVLSASFRFKAILLDHGHDACDVNDMGIIELRDAVSNLEYIEVHEGTSAGGTKVTRVPLKQAA